MNYPLVVSPEVDESDAPVYLCHNDEHLRNASLIIFNRLYEQNNILYPDITNEHHSNLFNDALEGNAESALEYLSEWNYLHVRSVHIFPQD